MAVVLASRRCLATGRKVPGRLARVGLGKSLQCTSEYPPASPTVCAWQVSSMSVIIVGSASHFSHTSFARMVCPWNSALGCSPRLTGMVCVVGAVYVYLFHRHIHGDLNQASRAVRRSLAPVSGVPASAWRHPAHPWACQAPMRDCTTGRHDVGVFILCEHFARCFVVCGAVPSNRATSVCHDVIVR